jgi:DNA-binding transcriptional regulator YiaG
MDKDEIKKLREILNLSQQSFATELGVSVATVSRWENGAFTPSPLAVAKLEELKNKKSLVK